MSQYPHDYTGPHYGSSPHPFEDPWRTMHDPPAAHPSVDPNDFRYEDEYRDALRQQQATEHWNAVARRQSSGPASTDTSSARSGHDTATPPVAHVPAAPEHRSWWTHTSDGRRVNRAAQVLPALFIGIVGGFFAMALTWFLATVLIYGPDGPPVAVPQVGGIVVGLVLAAIVFSGDPKP